ncbi:hypothetical protein K523DRAFT_411511 [Schizophyllum commune Tattone D]|nr:hypothetical protein K523DRAFT_411511 [Schizophyllum commune Tattone D]
MPKANKKEESPSKKFGFSSLFAKGMAVEDQMSRCAINPSNKDRRPKVIKAVKDVDTLTKAVRRLHIRNKRRDKKSRDAPAVNCATDLSSPVVTLTFPDSDSASSSSLEDQFAVDEPEQFDLSVATDEPPLIHIENGDQDIFPGVDYIEPAALGASQHHDDPIEVVDIMQALHTDEESDDTEVVTDILVEEPATTNEAPTVVARPTIRRKPRRHTRRDDDALAFPELPAIYLEGLDARQASQLLNLRVEEHDAGGAVRNRSARHRTQGTPAYKHSRPIRRTMPRSHDAQTEGLAPLPSRSSLSQCTDQTAGPSYEQAVQMEVCAI